MRRTFRILVITLVATTFAIVSRTLAATVYNFGISGNNSADLLQRLDKALEKKPTVVVLLVGTNDVLNPHNSLPIEQYETNLKQLLNRIEKAGSQILLMTAPPCYEPYLLKRHKAEFYGVEGPNGRIKVLNQVIQRVATESKVPIVDLYPLFIKQGKIGETKESMLRNLANSDKADGSHPTPEGYRMIGKVICQAIQKEHLNIDRIVCLGDSITFGAYVKGAGTATGETYPAVLSEMLKK